MAAAPDLLLMTVEQYRQLPTRDDVIQELHWGQVVTLTRPKMKHSRLQYRLVELLRPLAQGKGIVAAEVPFRALPEYDLRAADMAFISHGRWAAAEDDDNLHGSPELVIEVLSPSNTKAEMRDKAALYLSTGAEEFWLVDPKRQQVIVIQRQGGTPIYEQGQTMPVKILGGELKMADLFA